MYMSMRSIKFNYSFDTYTALSVLSFHGTYDHD